MATAYDLRRKARMVLRLDHDYCRSSRGTPAVRARKILSIKLYGFAATVARRAIAVDAQAKSRGAWGKFDCTPDRRCCAWLDGVESFARFSNARRAGANLCGVQSGPGS